MQYSPKLKIAAKEIEEILAKHDIAGMIVLHTPGYGEFILNINTSYSCAWIQGDALRMRAKKAEFATLAEWKQKVSDTSNMLNLLSDIGGRITMNLISASEMIDKAVGAEHQDGDETSHITQNN